MNHRTSIIEHPSDFKLKTPLLVPSFSSKGFALDENEKSELCKIMSFSKEFIYESQLVSAFDIYYGHIQGIPELNRTKVTFIDSGGYETSNNYDLSETRKYDRKRKNWNESLYNEVLKEWSELNPAIIVSFDDIEKRIPLEEQINNANEFFNGKSQFLTNFLIKPSDVDHNFINLDNIFKLINNLRNFDIIGITEKELGDSMFNRLRNIYLLRKNLDKASIYAPIHIFGALDPLSVILYFIMGAEIFDGLSWLKYDYNNAIATYLNNSAIIKNSNNLFLKDSEIRLNVIKDNIYNLESLKEILLSFQSNADYSIFDEIGGFGFGNKINEYIEITNKNL
jgi:hypothetical protein